MATTTTNYGLLKPASTDTYNHLIYDNPNMDTIDAQMKTNSDTGVTPATCVKSGTVHTVVRTNTDANVFRFTATGDWNTGDTMTVDGVTVSVFMPDGTAALNEAYVINTEVLALISGTRVTLMSNKPDLTSIQSDISDIQGDISAIETELTTGAWQNAGLMNAKLLYRKKDNIVEVYFFTDQTFSAGATTLFTLPTDYRPTIPTYPNSITIANAYQNAGNAYKDTLNINNNGEVKLEVGTTNAEWRMMHVIYLH